MVDDETKVLMEYQSKFGDLPDSRRMSDDALRDIVELCQMAIDRGSRLTRNDLKLSGEVPIDALS